MKIELVECIEQDGGSVTYLMDVSRDAILAFAKAGLHDALVKAAERAIKEHGTVTEEDAGGGDDDGGEREGIQAGGA
jgi:hypothetical protein